MNLQARVMEHLRNLNVKHRGDESTHILEDVALMFDTTKGEIRPGTLHMLTTRIEEQADEIEFLQNRITGKENQVDIPLGTLKKAGYVHLPPGDEVHEAVIRNLSRAVDQEQKTILKLTAKVEALQDGAVHDDVVIKGLRTELELRDSEVHSLRNQLANRDIESRL